MILLWSFNSHAQVPSAPSHLQTLGTRSWIRLSWTGRASNAGGYNVYWNTTNAKPASPNTRIPAGSTRYYITPVNPSTTYYVWVEAYNISGSSKALTGSVTTIRNWVLDAAEANDLSIPSSPAVPAGMQLYWQDEFNDRLLNRNKWSTNYYSTIDYLDTMNYTLMRNDQLPQPNYRMTDSSIVLAITNTAPSQRYWANGRKISSIQTYDWNANENYLDNRRGGYYEVRVRRNNTAAATLLNSAFWFDSPGPDLTYYEETPNHFVSKLGPVTGIRPHGQVFEIDVFEQSGNAATTTSTPFTIHGNVAANGAFQHNLGTYNARLLQQNEWNVHGVLWTPTSLKYYINGVLQVQWSDVNNMKPANHFMNVLLGQYAAGDSSSMEVDYIRGYQWPVVNGNELPNGGAEYSAQLFPWEGTATVSTAGKRSGNNGFVLEAGQTLVQYVNLDNKHPYQLKYWVQGSGTLEARVENITPVTGISQDAYLMKPALSSAFKQEVLDFKTLAEHGNNLKLVKVIFINMGTGSVTLDDIALHKGGSGGTAAVPRKM